MVRSWESLDLSAPPFTDGGNVVQAGDTWAFQALYRDDNETLEQAVVNKLDYILDVCRLGEGSHVLDVGAG